VLVRWGLVAGVCLAPSLPHYLTPAVPYLARSPSFWAQSWGSDSELALTLGVFVVRAVLGSDSLGSREL